MSSEIEAYQAAVKAHEAVAKTCADRAAQIKLVSEKLSYWHQAVVPNMGVQFPMTLQRNQQYMVDPNGWPTMERLASDLAAYHATKEHAQHMHASLPESIKDIVKLPPQ